MFCLDSLSVSLPALTVARTGIMRDHPHKQAVREKDRMETSAAAAAAASRLAELEAQFLELQHRVSTELSAAGASSSAEEPAGGGNTKALQEKVLLVSCLTSILCVTLHLFL